MVSCDERLYTERSDDVVVFWYTGFIKSEKFSKTIDKTRGTTNVVFFIIYSDICHVNFLFELNAD